MKTKNLKIIKSILRDYVMMKKEEDLWFPPDQKGLIIEKLNWGTVFFGNLDDSTSIYIYASDEI
jgi:hypothetical protein